MTTAGEQERMVEARAIHARVKEIATDDGRGFDTMRMIMIFAGILTETLLEYEEPETVMEQSFFRIADLLKVEPAEGNLGPEALPPLWIMDRDTESGRELARLSAEKLVKGLDDVHEIAIALAINDFPLWEQEELPKEESFRLLIECVISTLTLEMAAQSFCDSLIDEFIADGWEVTTALSALAALSGVYLREAGVSGQDSFLGVMNVMAGEAARHGVKGSKNWSSLGGANDFSPVGLSEYTDEIRESAEEFFDTVGLESQVSRSVAVAKAVGRMVAVVSAEDIGHIQPTVAKSLAKTGFLQGMKMIPA